MGPTAYSFSGHATLSENSAKPLLVCLSHLRWDFVFQRPQHLMTRATHGHRVIFFEEPVYDDVPRAELSLARREADVVVARPIIPHAQAANAVAIQTRLLDALLERVRRTSLTLWYYTPMALEFSRHLRADLVVFDKMDELSAFRGAPQDLVDLEEELMSRADLVFTGGQSLYEATVGRHSRVHAFPSSIDAAHFALARETRRDPEDQAGIPGPRLGFFGVVDERMNLDLVEQLADRRPDWQIVIIGPVVKIDPDILPRRPNLHWLGQKAYRELPLYLSGWDVGIMPFAINEATRFISPTKTPEFLAAGRPVVSTPITDVVRPYGREGLVAIASDAAEFEKAVEAAMSGADRGWLRRVDRKLAQGSWDQTWRAMARHMIDLRGDAPIAAAPVLAGEVARV